MPDPVKLRAVHPAKAKRTPPTLLETLVRLEGEAIAAPDAIALHHHAVNAPRALLDCHHIFWISRRGGSPRIEAVTGQERVERTTPLMQWITSELRTKTKAGALNEAQSWTLQTRRESDPIAYPFVHLHYAPFSPDAKAGGLLFAAAMPHPEASLSLMKRLGEIYGLIHTARRGAKRARLAPRKRNILLATAATLGLIGLIPIPMTTLAPAEIVADAPAPLAPEFDGIIAEILVQPNAAVRAGDPLVRLDDVTLRNELALAEKALDLAQVRHRMAGLRAFVDAEAKRDMAVAEAEAALATARRDYARDRLDKSVLRAPRDGIALFADVSELTGRPVASGEAILKIADPARVVLQLQAPVSHGEALQAGAKVRMFLDSDSVQPLSAELTRASYRASETAEGGMAFEAIAELDKADTLPRIGARGVAKIYGEKAPIFYWLVRKPLTLFRQFTGL